MSKKKPRTNTTREKLQQARQIGFEKGCRARCRRCSHKKLRAMQITNNNLWSILCELDRTDPIEGFCLSFQQGEEVVKALKTGEKKTKLASTIRRKMNNCDAMLEVLFGQLLDK